MLLVLRSRPSSSSLQCRGTELLALTLGVMVVSPDEAACFRRAVELLCIAFPPRPRTGGSDLPRREGLDSSDDDDSSSSNPRSISLDEAGQLVRLCLELLLVDGDPRRLVALLDDGRFVGAMKRVLTTNPSPQSSSSVPPSLRLRTPIALSLFQNAVLDVVRDVFVAAAASQSPSATLVPQLLDDNWLDLMLRYLSLASTRGSSDTVAVVLEAIFVLSTMFIKYGAVSAGGATLVTHRRVAGLLGFEELCVVLDCIQTSMRDATVRNYGLGIVQLWLSPNHSNAATKVNVTPRLAALPSLPLLCVASGREAEVVNAVADVVVRWIASDGRDALAACDVLPPESRFTWSCVVELLLHVVLDNDRSGADDDVPMTPLPRAVVTHRDDLLGALLSSYALLVAEGGTLAQLPTRYVRPLSVVPSWLSVGQILELLLVHTEFCRDMPVQTLGTLFRYAVDSDYSSAACRWCRLATQTLLAAGRLDDVCHALFYQCRDDVATGTAPSTSVRERREHDGTHGDDRPPVLRRETLWSSAHRIIVHHSCTTLVPSSSAKVDATAPDVEAVGELSLLVAQVLVASYRSSVRRTLAREIALQCGVPLLRAIHRCFLVDGLRGGTIVRLSSHDGELLNSVAYADEQLRGVWDNAEALYSVCEEILSPDRVDLLACVTSPNISSGGGSAEMHLSSEWVAQHHKLTVGLISAAMVTLMAAEAS